MGWSGRLKSSLIWRTMIESGFRPEQLPYIAETVLSLWAIAMAFTTAQRKWIRERDGNVCQACILGLPHSSECTGRPGLEPHKRKNQVHHVIPQRYAKVIGMETADFAENGITLGASFHQEDIHPDMKKALHRYRGGDKGSFKRVGVDRNALLSEGVIYWNSTHDRLLSTRAIQNTQRHEKDNPFPKK